MLTEEFLRYLKYERAYSQKTIEAYSNDLKEFRSFFEERIDSVFAPETVDADIVRQWEVYLLEHERMSARSVNRKLSALKSFFRYLLKSKKIASNPLHLLSGPKTKKPLPCFIKEKDMLEVLDGDFFGDDFEGIRNRLIVETLYDTGMRRSELAGLKDSDVDMSAMLLKVTGKRNKQRLIPFAQRLKGQIEHYWEVRRRDVGETDGWLFVNANGQQISADVVYKVVKSALNNIPMLSKRSPHVLRHTFATSMLNNGAELNAVKELLGHSSLASTSVYTHTTFEELKRMYHAHPRAK